MIILFLQPNFTIKPTQLNSSLGIGLMSHFLKLFSTWIQDQHLKLIGPFSIKFLTCWHDCVYTGMHHAWITAMAEVIHLSCLLCPRNTEWEKDIVLWKRRGRFDSKWIWSLSKSKDYVKTSSNISESENISQSESVWQEINRKAYDITQGHVLIYI